MDIEQYLNVDFEIDGKPLTLKVTHVKTKEVEKKKIVVVVEGGVIQEVSGVPKDVVVEVHDYDTDGSEPEKEETDGDGNNYLKSEWE